MDHLASHFSISVTSVHRIIHKILKLIHILCVQKYIKWPSINEWNRYAGSVDNWPAVVGFLGNKFYI